MSAPYHGNEMDSQIPRAGSVKRARELAQAGGPRGAPPPLRIPMTQPMSRPGYDGAGPRTNSPQSRPRPRAPPGLVVDGNIGESISRPRQVPQWPLAGPTQSPIAPADSGFSQPQGLAPRRPPRPSVVPSILDQSRVQDPSPVFLSPQYHSPQDRGSDSLSTPVTPSSRLTTSSVGSIPDFPMPIATNQPGPPRRSAVLGPPPSSRRGQSSFYSTASFVSPIPEESPKSRSHGSYASSAAIPNQWEPASSLTSPVSPGAFYEDSITDKSRDSDFEDFDVGDESNLVRSASIGKKGKPSLIVTGTPSASYGASRPAPSPVQPFGDGTAYIDASTSSSNTLPTTRGAQNPSFSDSPVEATADSILEAYAAATSADPTESPRGTPSPRPLQGFADLRRPPRLDMEAVRDAEARGSLTSLPDLIRRATRLAAMIEGGKRPASRFDELRDYFGGGNNGGYPTEKDMSGSDERYRSGLSDMLAAFPPPAQATRQPRGSWFRTTSWPLAPGRRSMQPPNTPPNGSRDTPPADSEKKRGRRCCGLPMWAFIMLVILVLLIIATAIVIPLQFFVFNTLGNQDDGSTDMSLEDCRSSLNCQNGGTNVVSQGVCSCICTNGFSGSECTVPSSAGCTTTTLVGSDESANIEDVTLGRAIPRLIADANTNFSIPLSGTEILATFNNGDLSCIAQNSLVTFNGLAMRIGDGETLLLDDTVTADGAFITLVPGQDISPTVPGQKPSSTTESPAASTEPSQMTTRSEPTSSETETTTVSTAPPSETSPPADLFTVDEQMLDFARVAVLFILQEESADEAVNAQTNLQDFFDRAQRSANLGNTNAIAAEASNLDLGGNNSIDLVDFNVDIGDGPVGRNVD